jgi:hypothetical protein
MLTPEALAELQVICPGATEMVEGTISFIYLPGLKIFTGGGTLVADALLCPQARDGYLTRLFVSQMIPGRGNNWTTHRILDRVWHTWSWNGVSANSRPAEILAEHLRALR